MAAAKSSRPSPTLIDSMSQPITSTPKRSSTPPSARATAQLRAVWPPMLASRASGRSRSMTLATQAGVTGST